MLDASGTRSAANSEPNSDRLATTDELGHRIFVHPADVRGRFRTWRRRVHFVLIFVFLALPWIRINDRQWLLLDIAHRRFEIFGLSLRAHNTPLLFLCLAIAGFGLFFVTAVWGRVWCGWACPQTVFIDSVFRRIERWIEGAAMSRRQLDQAPWDLEKIRKRGLKWMLFAIAALAITHSFLAYFVGGRELIDMITSSPTQNWTSFLFILITSAIVLFDFAWFREQFCIIVCPYGRFQSVLMDEHSMVIGYDKKRGEPRRPSAGAKKAAEITGDAAVRSTVGSAVGDCVNCLRCVQVCPTGIDIRRGTQLECVACTACVDACDDVMTKIKRPTGLIRYTSARELAGRKARPFRARTLIYLVMIVAATLTLVTLLAVREPVEITVLRAKGAPYDMIHANGRADVVVNRFQLEISNQSDITYNLHFRLADTSENPGTNDIELVVPLNPYVITAGQIARADIFIRFPKSQLKNGQMLLPLIIEERADDPKLQSRQLTKEVPLVGPFL